MTPEQLSKTKLKDLRALTTGKGRDKSGLFLAEGERIVVDALERGLTPHTIVFDEERFLERPSLRDVFERLTEQQLANQCFLANKHDFADLADTVNSQGVVASFDIPQLNPRDAFEKSPSTFLVLDNVRDPGNLGTILRHAAAFDCAGIFLLKGCCDPLNAKAVRASMGGIFTIALETKTEISDLLERFREHNIVPFACEKRDHAVAIREAMAPEKVAFVIGGETDGLQPAWRELGVQSAIIPQSQRVESLNAAVTASIALAMRYQSMT